MAEISATLVKELREKTGAGMMDCKRALDESDGDLDKAVDYLRTKGLADAAKKSSRVAAEGLVTANTSADGKSGAVIEVNCETDFVAKTDDFIELCNDLLSLVIDKKPADLDALNNTQMPKYNAAVSSVIAEKVAKIGENIKIRRFAYYSVASGLAESYIHMGGKIGVLLEVEPATESDKEILRDLALHICAANPLSISADELDQELIAHEREIYTIKAKESGKPDNIIEKIVDGQINKFKQDSCLLSQMFVKNQEITIEKLLNGKKVVRFTRYQLGEGLEKRKDDFVEEVKKQAGLA